MPVEGQVTVRMRIPLAMIGVVGTGCGLDGRIDTPELAGLLHTPRLAGVLDDDDLDGDVTAPRPAGGLDSPGLDGEVGCGDP